MNNIKPIPYVKIKTENIIGEKYGLLTILGEAGFYVSSSGKTRKRKVLCICDCGNKTEAVFAKIKGGYTRSCGCIRGELHEFVGTRFYHIWASIKSRCNNKKSDNYKNWGGRGISICKKWNNFLGFKKDMYKSYLESVKKHGEKNTSIDRANNGGNYEKNNCRWATCKEQANNTRGNRLLTFRKDTLNTAQWGEKTGLGSQTIRDRLDRYGWSLEKTLTTPIRQFRT